jgi:hypothetical protein
VAGKNLSERDARNVRVQEEPEVKIRKPKPILNTQPDPNRFTYHIGYAYTVQGVPGFGSVPFTTNMPIQDPAQVQMMHKQIREVIEKRHVAKAVDERGIAVVGLVPPKPQITLGIMAIVPLNAYYDEPKAEEAAPAPEPQPEPEAAA